MRSRYFLTRYKYLVAFLISFVIIAPFVIQKKLADIRMNQTVQANLTTGNDSIPTTQQTLAESNHLTATNTTGIPLPADQTVCSANTGSSEGSALTSNIIEGASISGSTEVAETTEGMHTTESDIASQDSDEILSEVPEPADSSYFDNALFIGDSRTMGLCEYGDIGNADVFASTGMNVYDLLSKKSSVASKDGENKTLEETLTNKKYSKIYFMLGINELGYDFGKTVEKYKEMVQLIREKQPDAELVLELNQHVTEVQSQQRPLFGNENINKINEAIRAIGREEGLRVLDVNVLFDDSTGALNPAVTFDNVHVLGKYYKEWTDWILQMETGKTTIKH